MYNGKNRNFFVEVEAKLPQQQLFRFHQYGGANRAWRRGLTASASDAKSNKQNARPLLNVHLLLGH
jgi:hypothetical protein